MGKASRWFRGLLGLTKPDSFSTPSAIPEQSKIKKWNFLKSHRAKVDHSHGAFKTAEVVSNNAVPKAALRTRTTTSSSSGDGNAYQKENPEKHAIAVAAASPALAEAAVAAAAVVKLTSSSGSFVSREEWAAVTIQSHFRAYLAKRAFRALRALVKLQALVRGHMVRKQSADILRRMHALLRAQARARAGRAQIYDSSYASIKSAQFHHTGPATPEKFERSTRAKSIKQDQLLMLKRNRSKSNCGVVMDQDAATLGWNWVDDKDNERSREQRGSSIRCGLTDDDKSDNILEINAGKPLFTTKRKALFPFSHRSLGSDQHSHSFTASQDSTAHQTVISPYSCEFHQDVEGNSYFTADGSPQYFSASSRGDSSRRGPFTPTQSGGSRSCLSGYSNHRNYMAYTESSRAKMRSLSAPKQRPHFERSSSTNMLYSNYGFGDSRSSSTQRVSSSLYANFTSKAYPGSGRLDRLGMPIRG